MTVAGLTSGLATGSSGVVDVPQVELGQHRRVQDANDQNLTAGRHSVEHGVLADERPQVGRNFQKRSP